MSNLTEPLNKAQSGEYTAAYLRELYDAEQAQLASAMEAHDQGAQGWLSAKDLLDGDTADAKMNDYIARGKALGEANSWLIKEFNARQKRELPDLPPVQRAAAGEKTFAAAGQTQRQDKALTMLDQAWTNLPQHKAVYKAMLASDSAQAFAAMSPTKRAEVSRVPGTLLGEVKTGDYIPLLKASIFDSATGILPSDRMGMPYPLLTMELEYLYLTEEPGSIIRYFPSRAIVEATSGTVGDAQVRARMGTINEMTDDTDAVVRPKHSIGALAKVALEDLNDHGRISERTNKQLDIGVRDQLTHQIFQGVKATANNWDGIMPELSTVAASLTALGRTDNAIAVPANTEPLDFLTQMIGELAERGCFPTVLFVGRDAWAAIKASQRVLRNQQQDYMRTPFGMVEHTVPMCLSRQLGTNQALIMDASKTVEVVLGEEVQSMVSEHLFFNEGAVAIRRMLYGNNAFIAPYGGIKLTSTQNFTPASFS